MTGRAADDFEFIRNRQAELRKEEGRQPIEIAGPAGNPTQPTGAEQGTAQGGLPDFCGACGCHQSTGQPHASSCPNARYDNYCC